MVSTVSSPFTKIQEPRRRGDLKLRLSDLFSVDQFSVHFRGALERPSRINARHAPAGSSMADFERKSAMLD